MGNLMNAFLSMPDLKRLERQIIKESNQVLPFIFFWKKIIKNKLLPGKLWIDQGNFHSSHATVCFCKVKLNVRWLWWGERKSQRCCSWREPHASSLCSHSIPLLLQDGSRTGTVIGLSTFKTSSWGHVFLLSTERRGRLALLLLIPPVHFSLLEMQAT